MIFENIIGSIIGSTGELGALLLIIVAATAELLLWVAAGYGLFWLIDKLQEFP